EGQVVLAGLQGVGNHQAVVADQHLDDVLDAVLLAVGELTGLHAPRGVGDVGEVGAHAAAEHRHAAAGAGGFHLGGGVAGGAAETLRHNGGKGVHGGGTHHADVVAGSVGLGTGQNGGHGGAGQKGLFDQFHVSLQCALG